MDTCKQRLILISNFTGNESVDVGGSSSIAHVRFSLFLPPLRSPVLEPHLRRGIGYLIGQSERRTRVTRFILTNRGTAFTPLKKEFQRAFVLTFRETRQKLI